MKFKKLSLIFLILSFIAVLTGCNQDVPVSSSSVVGQIKSKGKLVIGTSADYPPFEFHKLIDGKDEIVGMDISMAKEIAKDLGVELEIKDMDFDGLIAALASDNVDLVLAAMSEKEDRKQSVDFSNVYFIAEQLVLVRDEDVEKYKTLDDLKNAKIGAQKGTLQEEIAEEEFPDAEIRALGKVTDLVLDLKIKSIDALILEKPVAKAYAANTDGVNVCAVEITDDSGYAIALKKGNTELLAEVNKTIERIKDDGSLDKFLLEANDLYDQ